MATKRSLSHNTAGARQGKRKDVLVVSLGYGRDVALTNSQQLMLAQGLHGIKAISVPT